MHRIIQGAIIAATSLVAIGAGSAADASVNIDTAGKGFVGKGDVQTTLGFNNKALQTAVDSPGALVFTAQQPTTQSLSQNLTQLGTQDGSQVGTQTGTQVATQVGTQVVGQDLTCTFTNGSVNNVKTFHRDGERDGSRLGERDGSRTGERDGSRTGERDGSRTGSQAGIQSGKLAYSLDVEARKSTQYTGFILKGWAKDVPPTYAEVGGPAWTLSFGEWMDSDFGAYHFAEWTDADFAADAEYDFAAWTDADFAPWADSDFDATTWGDWDALPGENPDDCLRSQNADKITQISNIITPGAITNGAIDDGDITDGAIEDGLITDGAIEDGAIDHSAPIVRGEVIANGTAKVFVNGKAV